MPSRDDTVDGAQPSDPERSPAPGGPVVVGIGASAGGLRALKEFFSTVPSDTGIVFVVVVHLSPDHESHLADLLQVQAAIPVSQVTGETPLDANRAYVIPPGRNLSAVDSHLRLAALPASGTGRAPVDHFFRTLAETHDGASIGVILSGTGTDGAAGIRYIRDHGGMVVAQDPDEAEYDGMPRSAIATGSVDRVLPIARMMPQILEFARTRPAITTPAAFAGDEGSPRGDAADPVQTVLTLVRLRTGHDFSRYKRSTVARRVARRMQVLNVTSLGDYASVLRDDPQEARTLLDDLLINVTRFFRDPEVFGILEAGVIASLFDGKERVDSVRVWSVGCATGEEAYSLGMLLVEEASRRTNAPQVQVFATDLHEPSLQHGRDALYSHMIEAEISPERLERFFRRETDGYRITKELRDIVVFASHNLLRDPPFSRQDLILCRNVLIYLQRDVQDEVVEIFHYSLRTGGRLMLGTAETLDRTELFSAENKSAHLYRRRDEHRGTLRLHTMPANAPARTAATALMAHPSPGGGFSAVHQRMLEHLAPPSLLVGDDHDVIHLSPNVGRYLRLPGGEPTTNLFKLVREEFGLELRAALHVARERRMPWRSRPIASRIDGAERFVTIRVSPADEAQYDGLSLVFFDETDGDIPTTLGTDAPPDARVLAIEAELDATRSRMHALIEEFESSQEEMQATNEELQSTNEELRSTMEELETSREELQSVNEELQTLNQENRHKVEELFQLSNDLQNLLQATDIATIFLDRNLRILRYTPRVSEIFNVRQTDRGRPLADLTHRLGYQHLIDDARRVLQTLVPVEREVEGPSPDSSYSLRIVPYRTLDDRIDGVVMSFIDVTALKHTEQSLRQTQERQKFLLAVEDAIRPLSDPVEIQRAASRLLGEYLGVDRLEYGASTEDHLLFRISFAGDVDGASASPREWSPDELALLRDVGGRVWDAVERARASQALRESEERFRLTVEGASTYAILTFDGNGTIDSWSRGAEAVFGWTAAEAVGQPLAITFTPDDRAAHQPQVELVQARQRGSAPDNRWHQRKDGRQVFIDGATHRLPHSPAGERFMKIGRDATMQRNWEQALRELNESLEARVAERTSELSRANAARDALRLELVQAEEQERARLARELHDEVGQHLTALALGLHALSDLAQPGSEVDRRTAQLREMVGALSQEMHAIAVRLRPRALDDFGLLAALTAYVDAWSQRSGIAVDLHVPEMAERLSPAVESAVYRVVQEALTNVAKHSRATRASVSVEQRDGQVVAIVEDDGQGFVPVAAASEQRASSGLGLLGIQERAALLGGTAQIESAVGVGTSVFVRIPVASATLAAHHNDDAPHGGETSDA